MNLIQQTKTRIRLLSKLSLAKVYLSAGMPRSGSTVLYNILRLILREHFGDQIASGWVGDLYAFPKRPVYLIKTHTVGGILRHRSTAWFYTYRDIRTAMLSEHRKFGVTPSLATAELKIRQYLVAQKHATGCFNYEEVCNRLDSVVERISSSLGIECDNKKIALASSYQKSSEDSSDSRYCSETNFHKNHITNTHADEWRNELDPTLIKKVNAKYEWWFRECGYPLH